jgi:hypothetical protein
MRVFKTRYFARFARQESIWDEALAKAIRQVEAGLIEADLGGGLIKIRLARPGSGKRGGYRTLIAYSKGAHAVFLFGFAKNERDNIAPDQLAELKTIATGFLGHSQKSFTADVTEGRLQEVSYDDEN